MRDKKRGNDPNDLPSIVSHNGIEIVGIPCEHPMLRKLSSLSFRERSMDQTHSRRGLEVGRSLARGSAMLFESSYKRVQRACHDRSHGQGHCFSRNPAAVPPCKEQSRASGELGSERARGGRSDDWKKRNRCIYCVTANPWTNRCNWTAGHMLQGRLN